MNAKYMLARFAEGGSTDKSDQPSSWFSQQMQSAYDKARAAQTAYERTQTLMQAIPVEQRTTGLMEANYLASRDAFDARSRFEQLKGIHEKYYGASNLALPDPANIDLSAKSVPAQAAQATQAASTTRATTPTATKATTPTATVATTPATVAPAPVASVGTSVVPTGTITGGTVSSTPITVVGGGTTATPVIPAGTTGTISPTYTTPTRSTPTPLNTGLVGQVQSLSGGQITQPMLSGTTYKSYMDRTPRATTDDFIKAAMTAGPQNLQLDKAYKGPDIKGISANPIASSELTGTSGVTDFLKEYKAPTLFRYDTDFVAPTVYQPPLFMAEGGEAAAADPEIDADWLKNATAADLKRREDVIASLPKDWFKSYTAEDKVKYYNEKGITAQDLLNIGEKKVYVDYGIKLGLGERPAQTALRTLPTDFQTYTGPQKIDYFNTYGVTAADLRNAGETTGNINAAIRLGLDPNVVQTPTIDKAFAESPVRTLDTTTGQFVYTPAAKLTPATSKGTPVGQPLDPFRWSPPGVTIRPRQLLNTPYLGPSASQLFAQQLAAQPVVTKPVLGLPTTATPASGTTATPAAAAAATLAAAAAAAATPTATTTGTLTATSPTTPPPTTNTIIPTISPYVMPGSGIQGALPSLSIPTLEGIRQLTGQVTGQVTARRDGGLVTKKALGGDVSRETLSPNTAEVPQVDTEGRLIDENAEMRSEAQRMLNRLKTAQQESYRRGKLPPGIQRVVTDVASEEKPPLIRGKAIQTAGDIVGGLVSATPREPTNPSEAYRLMQGFTGAYLPTAPVVRTAQAAKMAAQEPRATMSAARESLEALGDIPVALTQPNQLGSQAGAVRPYGKGTVFSGVKLANDRYVGSSLDDYIDQGKSAAFRTSDVVKADAIQKFFDTKARRYMSTQLGTERDPVFDAIKKGRISNLALHDIQGLRKYAIEAAGEGKYKVDKETGKNVLDQYGRPIFYPKDPQAVMDVTKAYDEMVDVKPMSFKPGLIPQTYKTSDPAYMQEAERIREQMLQAFEAEGLDPRLVNLKSDPMILTSTRDTGEPYYPGYLYRMDDFIKDKLSGNPEAMKGVPENIRRALDQDELLYDVGLKRGPLEDILDPESMANYLATLSPKEIDKIRFEDAVVGSAKFNRERIDRKFEGLRLQELVKSGKAPDKVFSKGVSEPLLQFGEDQRHPGFAWKRIEDLEATIPEGAYVGHSVGGYALGGTGYGPSFTKGFQEGTHEIYSLRDARNRPVTTIQVIDYGDKSNPYRVVKQIKGNGAKTGNTAPVDYDVEVYDFLTQVVKPDAITESDSYLTPMLIQYRDALEANRQTR